MGKLTNKREKNLWLISSLLFLIFAIIALTFYIPVFSHLLDVTEPTPLEEGELDPPRGGNRPTRCRSQSSGGC